MPRKSFRIITLVTAVVTFTTLTVLAGHSKWHYADKDSCGHNYSNKAWQPVK